MDIKQMNQPSLLLVESYTAKAEGLQLTCNVPYASFTVCTRSDITCNNGTCEKCLLTNSIMGMKEYYWRLEKKANFQQQGWWLSYSTSKK